MPAADAPLLAAHRTAVGDSLANAAGLVLALDFDGTLAPIVDDPDDATIEDRLREILADLAATPTVEPAIVSGRELADLRNRVGIDGIDYAGNHGLELRVDGDRTVPDRAGKWAATIDALCGELEDGLADVEGCVIENKGLTATVHVRQVPEDLRDGVEQVVRDAVASTDTALEVSDGKAIWEIRPPVEWDKGRAVDRLADRTPDDWLPIYVGDDVTDEDAFEALAGRDEGCLTVSVGERVDTAADYRLRSQKDVVDFLSLIAERR